DRARRPRPVHRHRRAVCGLALPLAGSRRRFAAAGSRRVSAYRRRRDDHGPAASLVAGSRRAVSSRVDPGRPGPSDSPQLSGRRLMFQALMEKLTRHEDLTSDEAAAAMTEVMEGRAAASHIAGLLIGLAMKGERPAEIVGLARTMRAHAVHVSKRYDDLFDTCGTGGGPLAALHIYY